MAKKNRVRQIIGALIFDVHRFIWGILSVRKTCLSPSWVFIRNRNENLISDTKYPGVKCSWQWTSDLYLPKVFPVFGRWLFRRAFRDFPIVFRDQPDITETEKPVVSFIIGHRGMERLPLLLATLRSIAGQRGCGIECIVVEQDNEKFIQDELPDWVRYIHTPLPDKNMPYSRSWAFNVAAQEAKSDCLIFHDNDMLVPAIYAKDIVRYCNQGYDFINLKRFIFYLDQVSSEKLAVTGDLSRTPVIEVIVQNLEAGGSFGAGRQAYFDIGGFDERFVGWGGEDNEFWERANTRKVYPYGYLPIVHLWHAPQLEKKNRLDCDGVYRYKELKKQAPQNRIKELRSDRNR